MTIPETEPIEIRTDETGKQYIPLNPAPGMRSVAIGAGDAVVLCPMMECLRTDQPLSVGEGEA